MVLSELFNLPADSLFELPITALDIMLGGMAIAGITFQILLLIYFMAMVCCSFQTEGLTGFFKYFITGFFRVLLVITAMLFLITILIDIKAMEAAVLVVGLIWLIASPFLILDWVFLIYTREEEEKRVKEPLTKNDDEKEPLVIILN